VCVRESERERERDVRGGDCGGNSWLESNKEEIRASPPDRGRQHPLLDRETPGYEPFERHQVTSPSSERETTGYEPFEPEREARIMVEYLDRNGADDGCVQHPQLCRPEACKSIISFIYYI